MLIIKWAGTVLCLIGIALTAFNHFPENVWFSLVGSLLWTLAAYLQRDMPLLLVEAVAVLMYMAGVVTIFFW